MNEKTAEKSKRLIQAELNFISQKPLEVVVQEIQALVPKAVTVQVEWTGADTALFQLTYNRDGRTTAEVSGRLQRWAGDMTHIYCDGRAFQKKIHASRLVRWIVIATLAAPLFTYPLAILSTSVFTSTLFWFSLIAFTLVAFVIGIFRLVAQVMGSSWMEHHNPKQGLSKPEKKDRERLLQFLTEIIRDEDYVSQDVPDGETLSDEEAIAFLERAALKARLKKL